MDYGQRKMSEEPGEFANAPQSITELRSEREGDMSLWTPRDVLVHILRQIDSGEIEPKHVVVAMRRKTGDDFFTDHWKSAPDIHTVVGLLEIVKLKIVSDFLG